MTDSARLNLVRAVHTAIYFVMVAAIFAVLYAGISRAGGVWLWLALVLVGLETVIFAGSGMKCPLSAVAAKYTAPDTGRPVSDTFLPERFTRHTLTIFGPLIALGLVLLAIRWGRGLLG